MDLREGKLNPTMRADLNTCFFFFLFFERGFLWLENVVANVTLAACLIFPHFLSERRLSFAILLFKDLFALDLIGFLQLDSWTRVLIVQVTWGYNGNQRIMLRGRSLVVVVANLHRKIFPIFFFFDKLVPPPSSSIPLRRTWSLVKLLEWIPTVAVPPSISLSLSPFHPFNSLAFFSTPYFYFTILFCSPSLMGDSITWSDGEWAKFGVSHRKRFHCII